MEKMTSLVNFLGKFGDNVERLLEAMEKLGKHMETLPEFADKVDRLVTAIEGLEKHLKTMEDMGGQIGEVVDFLKANQKQFPRAVRAIEESNKNISKALTMMDQFAEASEKGSG